jgi:hypothetical protein
MYLVAVLHMLVNVWFGEVRAEGCIGVQLLVGVQSFDQLTSQSAGRPHDGPHIRPDHLRGKLRALGAETRPGVRRSRPEMRKYGA